MNMRFYTNEQVHQIVDQLLLQFDEAAPGPEPVHLKNDIPQQSSPENKVTLTVSEAAEMIGISKPIHVRSCPRREGTVREGGEKDPDIAAVSAGLVEERRNIWR